MTCRELTDFLTDYVDGELPSDVRAHFEQHMTACPPCHAYLRQYEITIATGRAIGSEPPADIPDELVQAILAARRALPDR